MPKRTYSLFILLIILSGCSLTKTAVSTREGASMEAPLHAPYSLRANAVVELSGEESLRGKAVILVRRPDLFRIDILGPFNQTAVQLLSDGKRLALYSRGETTEHLWGEPGFPYPFESGEVVRFLLGAVDSEKRSVLEGWSSLERDNGRAVKFVKKKDGLEVLTVVMEDFRIIEGARIPFVISIEGDGAGLRISYTSVEIDPELDPALFERVF